MMVITRFLQLIPNSLIIWKLNLEVMSVIKEGSNFKMLMMRSILGFVSWFLHFYSIKFIPLGLISTITNMQPFFTLILGFLILKETLKRLEIINMLASFSGVLIIVTGSSNQKRQSQNETSGMMFIIAVGLSTFSSLLIGLINVLIRAMKKVHWSLMSGF